MASRFGETFLKTGTKFYQNKDKERTRRTKELSEVYNLMRQAKADNRADELADLEKRARSLMITREQKEQAFIPEEQAAQRAEWQRRDVAGQREAVNWEEYVANRKYRDQFNELDISERRRKERIGALEEKYAPDLIELDYKKTQDEVRRFLDGLDDREKVVLENAYQALQNDQPLNDEQIKWLRSKNIPAEALVRIKYRSRGGGGGGGVPPTQFPMLQRYGAPPPKPAITQTATTVQAGKFRPSVAVPGIAPEPVSPEKQSLISQHDRMVGEYESTTDEPMKRALYADIKDLESAIDNYDQYAATVDSAMDMHQQYMDAAQNPSTAPDVLMSNYDNDVFAPLMQHNPRLATELRNKFYQTLNNATYRQPAGGAPVMGIETQGGAGVPAPSVGGGGLGGNPKIKVSK